MARFLSFLSAFVFVFAVMTDGYTNPIKTTNGSDPQMVYYEGMYYLTTTTWTNIQITAASTIDGLKTATPRVVWSDTTATRCCNVWAPEMHRINGRWYIYYTAGRTGTSYTANQRVWVLQGPTGNPLSGSYSFLSQVVPPNYSAGMLDPSVHTFSNGKTYFLFSAWPSVGQSVYISELYSPGSVGPATLIGRPTYSWETQGFGVNEGPEGISRNGRDFVVFSASSCSTQYYALGLLSLRQGADPLVASSWTKTTNPIFSSANGLYGTGHNAFFKGPNGVDYWNVFHANRAASGTCDGGRQTFVQKVNWNSDGTPNLGTPIAAGVSQADPV